MAGTMVPVKQLQLHTSVPSRPRRQPCRRCRVARVAATAVPSLQPAVINGTNGTSGMSAALVPQVVTVQAPPPIPGALPPPKTYEAAVQLGSNKAQMSVSKIIASGVLGGAFIGFGAWLLMAVGGACPGITATNPGMQRIIAGSWGLPFGLTMVLLSGSELFTGNTALVTLAALERRATLPQLLKSWAASYAGNFLGSLLLAALVFTSGTMAAAAAPAALAVAKTSLPFAQAFTRGLLCNWLVCMAIWQATSATSVAGKILGIYMPISAFVALGLEHSVANMFIIPLGMLNGASVSIGQFLTGNLLPVTLGNIVGGALCVAVAYAYTLGVLGKPAASPAPAASN